VGGYIFAIDADYPEHWQTARDHGFWDLTRSCRVQPADDVFFWLAGGTGLVGWVKATSAATPLTDRAGRPWNPRDPRVYHYRVSFDTISADVVRHMSWKEVQAAIDSRAQVGNGVITVKAANGVEALSRAFASSVAADMSWPRFDVELDIPEGHDSRDRSIREIAIRRGQRGFRHALTAAYGGRCAISGCAIDGVLEAAHISPYRGVETNDPRNGLLLRSDLHTLFDLHLLTVLPDGTVRVHPALQGSEYAAFDHSYLPGVAPDVAPSPTLLERHNRGCDWLHHP
jgi:putative restriction endonuclease